jgi:hypothetical protein
MYAPDKHPRNFNSLHFSSHLLRFISDLVNCAWESNNLVTW